MSLSQNPIPAEISGFFCRLIKFAIAAIFVSILALGDSRFSPRTRGLKKFRDVTLAKICKPPPVNFLFAFFKILKILKNQYF